MKNYIVFYIDWYNHTPESTRVNALTINDAMVSVASDKGYDFRYAQSFLENDLKQEFFNSDCMLHAHEVS